MMVGLPFARAMSKSTAPLSSEVKVTGCLCDSTANRVPAPTAPAANRALLSVGTESLTGGGACDCSVLPVQRLTVLFRLCWLARDCRMHVAVVLHDRHLYPDCVAGRLSACCLYILRCMLLVWRLDGLRHFTCSEQRLQQRPECTSRTRWNEIGMPVTLWSKDEADVVCHAPARTCCT